MNHPGREDERRLLAELEHEWCLGWGTPYRNGSGERKLIPEGPPVRISPWNKGPGNKNKGGRKRER